MKMWPMLLNLTHDECRRTLRRLELEAYSNMISVFRAQGALEDNRKKLLEELRAVLRISNDRHSAEARRVSNDELLATIAEQLSGPNTGLGWISEGRRRIPLLPRGIAQTMYTEIADKAAEAAAAENKEIMRKLDAEKLNAPKNEEEMSEAESQTADVHLNEANDEMMQLPVAMEDQTHKLWETEMISRKRKIPEGGAIPDDSSTPVKNIRNIPVNTNQKHLNLSQIYSKFSQPATSKPSGQSKHSYNQVSKVSTSKSHQPRAAHKHRGHKQSSKHTMTKSQMKKMQEKPLSPNSQYNSMSVQQQDFPGPPNTFQASYAQTILGGKIKPDYPEEVKTRVLSSPSMVTDSPTLQLLTQPPSVPHELGVTENAHPDDATTLQAQGMPTPKHMLGSKPCHLIIKKRGEVTPDKKVQMSELKLLQKPAEGIKVLNRQVVVAPNSAQKAFSSGKLVATKVAIGSVPKTRPPGAPALTEKVIVVSKASPELKAVPSSKIIITSAMSTPAKEIISVSTNSVLPKTTETLTPKGIPATDLKVSAKTVVLNPKSGQKMVVLPAKARTKPGAEGQNIPLLQFKNLSTGMKFVPVSSQTVTPVTRSSAMAVVSKPTLISTIPPTAKVINMEPIKTANLADIIPVKGLTPITTPKITNPIVRPVSTKGNVIVVQKGTPIGKALQFTKNGNDMSKIIMGKNINQLLQASKTDPTDVSKCAGNVIVLELNNEQTGRTTTMSEILDSRHVSVSREADDDSKVTQITQDTPVLFESQITDESCNANSLDSTVDSIGGIESMEDSSIPILEKEVDKSSYNKDLEGVEGGKDSSSVTDWEMELDTVSRKGKDDDKLNSLHLDLGMSSESENEYMVQSHKSKSKLSQHSMQAASVVGEPSEMYGGSSGLSLATRTLLSQLQDDGSSSNDSSFALKSKVVDKTKDLDAKIDRCESDALSKAKAKLSEKVAEAKSQQKRIDIYSTAITSSDINLDSFSYLEEGMMAGDDVFGEEKAREVRRAEALDDQLRRLLGEDSAHSTDSQTVSDSMPLTK